MSPLPPHRLSWDNKRLRAVVSNLCSIVESPKAFEDSDAQVAPQSNGIRILEVRSQVHIFLKASQVIAPGSQI